MINPLGVKKILIRMLDADKNRRSMLLVRANTITVKFLSVISMCVYRSFYVGVENLAGPTADVIRWVDVTSE